MKSKLMMEGGPSVSGVLASTGAGDHCPLLYLSPSLRDVSLQQQLRRASVQRSSSFQTYFQEKK